MLDYLSNPVDYRQPDTAEAFDELMLWSARFGILLLDHLTLAKNIRILDIGCGSGFPLFELAHTFGPTCEVVGVDPWEAAMKRAEFKRQIYGLSNVKLLPIDAASIPLPDGYFDLITSNLGINNFDDPAAVLRECWRLAKPGATLALTTNVKGHFAEFYAVFREVLADRSDYIERLNQQEDHRRDRPRLTALIESAGFQVSRVVEDRFVLRFADGSALLRHWLIRAGFLGGWRSVVDQADEQSVFTRLEAALNQIGELRLTVPMLYIEAQKPV